MKATQFLREELPVRLAHRAVELDNLPFDLSKMPSVIRVKEGYLQSFQELVDFPHPLDCGIPKELLYMRESTKKTGLFLLEIWTAF